MKTKKWLAIICLGLIGSCQAVPSTKPQPSPSPPTPTPQASPTSDISTVTGQTPAPSATASPSPAHVPSAPPAGLTATPSPTPPPKPVFFLPEPACPGCGYTVTSARQPRWSPDGLRLAYVLGEESHECPLRGCAQRSSAQLFVQSMQSSDAKALTAPQGYVQLAGWAPQGDLILLESPNRGIHGDGQIYTVKPDGTELARVYPTSLRQHLPSWSPDGQWIAYTSPLSDRDQTWIEVVKRDGSGWRQLKLVRFPRMIAWTADGRVAVEERQFSQIPGQLFADNRLYLLSPTGTTDFILPPFAQDKYLFEYRWSPDGRWLAYMALDETTGETGLILAAPDAASERRVSLAAQGFVRGLSWSPDSKYLAFSVASETPGLVPIENIYLLEASALALKQLTEAEKTDLPVKYHSPSWSPDSQRLAFISNFEAKFSELYKAPESLYTMKPDGTDIQREFAGSHVVKPAPTNSPSP